jgi:hypothetical protein
MKSYFLLPHDTIKNKKAQDSSKRAQNKTNIEFSGKKLFKVFFTYYKLFCSIFKLIRDFFQITKSKIYYYFKRNLVFLFNFSNYINFINI